MVQEVNGEKYDKPQNTSLSFTLNYWSSYCAMS